MIAFQSVNQLAAQVYARHSVDIIPCHECDGGGSKAKAPYLEGGLHNASADQTENNKRWLVRPNAAIGLPCRANGVIAIDADRHGQGDGVAVVVGLFAEHGFDPNTVPCIATPRDGRHFLFRRPAGLGNTKGKIAHAVDVRDNAFIIAAGSIMADGRCYALQNGTLEQLAAAIGNASLPEMPVWLAAMIAKPTSKPIVPRTGYARSPVTPGSDVRRRLAGVVRKVVLAPKGERNATLHWAACRAGEFIRAGIMPPEAALSMLIEAGRQAGLPESESQATVKSGIRNGYAGNSYER